MRLITRILGVTVALLSLHWGWAFAWEDDSVPLVFNDDSYEAIEKGRAHFGGRSFGGGARYQQPRQHFNVPHRTVSPSVHNAYSGSTGHYRQQRVRQEHQLSRQSQSSQFFGSRSHPGSGNLNQSASRNQRNTTTGSTGAGFRQTSTSRQQYGHSQRSSGNAQSQSSFPGPSSLTSGGPSRDSGVSSYGRGPTGSNLMHADRNTPNTSTHSNLWHGSQNAATQRSTSSSGTTRVPSASSATGNTMQSSASMPNLHTQQSSSGVKPSAARPSAAQNQSMTPYNGTIGNSSSSRASQTTPPTPTNRSQQTTSNTAAQAADRNQSSVRPGLASTNTIGGGDHPPMPSSTRQNNTMTPASNNSAAGLISNSSGSSGRNQSSQLNQAPGGASDSRLYTPVTMRYGTLAAPADSRLVHPNPFPGQSVEPQFLDTPGALTPVQSARIAPATSTVAPRPVISSDTQMQFSPRTISSQDGGMGNFVREAAHNHWVAAGVSVTEFGLDLLGQEVPSRALNTSFHTIQGATAENLGQGGEAIGATAVNMVPIVGPAGTALYHSAAGAIEGTIFEPMVTERTPEAAARRISEGNNSVLSNGLRNDTIPTYEFGQEYLNGNY